LLADALLAFARQYPPPAESEAVKNAHADRAKFWTMIEEREKMLRELEWSGVLSRDECPRCGGRKVHGHHRGCRLAALIGKGEKG
jgi:hypothetical protein